jgi:hypothetical protein
LVTINTGNAVTINLLVGQEKATHSFEIVSLPDWTGIKHITPTVIMPEADQTTVSVILNKSSEDEYSLSKPTNQRLPLLISRELSAISFITRAGSRKISVSS